jgi:hypothetical protein
MKDRRTSRTVQTALRCYPARWRRRHGDEAAELAALLIRDGTPAGSIARSYLAGAVREWLTLRRGRRLSTAACALLVAACSLGASAGLLASAAPAKAASAKTAPTQTAPGETAPTTTAPATTAPGETASTSRAAVLAPAPRRGGRPEPGPGTLPVTGRRQMIIWAAGHG